MEQLRQLLATKIDAAAGPLRRGSARQRPERALEEGVRDRAAAFRRFAGDQGWTLQESAQALGLLPRTLRQWYRDVTEGPPRALPLGRPTARSALDVRRQVLDFLQQEGPMTSVATLWDTFPDLTRAELTDLLRRYRRALRRRYPDVVHVLDWQPPGAVWAMDFAEAPAAIEQRYPYLFAVRDLASGRQLLWQPVEATTATVAQRALGSLVAEHGRPLVLKSDNGSAFIAETSQAYLEQAGVFCLFSPPGLPSYNGSCEAGIGSLKSRTEVHAARHGRPGQWTWDDVAYAHLQANACARPHGLRGPSADALWAQRRPLAEEERRAFAATVERHRAEACAERNLAAAALAEHAQRSGVDRIALRRALVEHGYLLFSRRRIPTPVWSRKVARVS
jgi:transposase InsO family protein